MTAISTYETSWGPLWIVNTSSGDPLWLPSIHGTIRVGIVLCVPRPDAFITTLSSKLIEHGVSLLAFFGFAARRAEDLADEITIGPFDDHPDRVILTVSSEGLPNATDLDALFRIVNVDCEDHSGDVIYIFDEQPRGPIEAIVRNAAGVGGD